MGWSVVDRADDELLAELADVPTLRDLFLKPRRRGGRLEPRSVHNLLWSAWIWGSRTGVGLLVLAFVLVRSLPVAAVLLGFLPSVPRVSAPPVALSVFGGALAVVLAAGSSSLWGSAVIRRAVRRRGPVTARLVVYRWWLTLFEGQRLRWKVAASTAEMMWVYGTLGVLYGGLLWVVGHWWPGLGPPPWFIVVYAAAAVVGGWWQLALLVTAMLRTAGTIYDRH